MRDCDERMLGRKVYNDSLPQGREALDAEARAMLADIQKGLASVVVQRDMYPALPFWCNRLTE